MRLLKKKVIKVLPVWLLALLLIGSATAAFVWISNMISTFVIVSDRSIVLTGGFTSTAYTNETVEEIISYTINNVSDSSGFIYLEFTASGSISTSDIEVVVDVWPTLSSMPQPGEVILANQTTANQITFLIERRTIGAFSFGADSSTGGNIYISITYKTATSLNAAIQITSTSS